ncbi:amidohydrolase family protein [Achlya hypogyna]|uniref:Amidohydrolase family protein n=1 Tax=Achlya hypogyna TaxID=1202772 RepID=A0A1V9ZU65_ACHHY|nr:amidohydrolase family protein [Achlya hypogyna]
MVPIFKCKEAAFLTCQFLSTMVLPTPLTADSTAALFAELTQLRRHFHQHAEVTWQEVQTQATIKAYLLEHAQIPEENIHVCATTGLVVNIYGPTPDDVPVPDGRKCIAFRGDMDALPMTENNPHLSYASVNAGAAHMCGHDGHMTSLVGFAVLMQRARHALPPHSCVRLLFQPAEEGGFGAVKMIEGGALEGVDEIYGYHNAPFPLGMIATKPGAVLAHSCRFEITLKGPGGHGSAPHLTPDPIVAAGHVIVAMQSIVSRSVPAQESAVVSITQVHGGEADNVIPSSVRLSGTLRDFSPAVAAIVHSRMETIVASTAAAYGVTGSITFDDGYPVTSNHAEPAQIVLDLAASVVGPARVTSAGLPAEGSEDFSYYLQKIPGCFYMVGTKEMGEVAAGGCCQNRGLHSDTFDFNDDALPLTVRMFLEIAQHRLGVSLYAKEELNLIR